MQQARIVADGHFGRREQIDDVPERCSAAQIADTRISCTRDYLLTNRALLGGAEHDDGVVSARERRGELTEVSGGVQLEGDGRSTRFTGTVLVEPADPGGYVRVAGKDYRGKLEVVRRAGGLVVVNVLSLETYLGGVVAAELGVQLTDGAEAMKAQAVIARTYAVKQMGRHRRDGFDLLATVADQKYDGVAGETSNAWLAIAGTRGEVATYRGAPIDAFFDKVTVNCPEPLLRVNRLRLLSAIRGTLGQVADFSRIEG